MKPISWVKITGVTALAATLIGAGTGCQDLPGSPGAQGATVGGVSGAAIGAAVAKDNRLLGALIGGALGAGGGYLIGANKDKILGDDSSSAEQAVQKAQSQPATPEQARTATTADLNNDGFVTMDEVVAMEKAGYTDQQIIERLDRTDQVYELTAEQEGTLRDQGVSENVIDRLPQINRDLREQVLTNKGSGEIISEPQSGSDRN